MKKLKCATFEGIIAQEVVVESTLTKGLPTFNIVGMASTAITESKERVKSALLSNDFSFPPKRITINLSPSDIKKEGSQFDLGIALLIALDSFDIDISSFYVFGELGLDGSVKQNTLLFPLVLSLASLGVLKQAIVPKDSLCELKKIPNIKLIGVENLNQAIDIVKNNDYNFEDSEKLELSSFIIQKKHFYYNEEYIEDFCDVKGQVYALRASLIASSGMHNILLEGSPGCGKSMISKRLRYILPAITHSELLNIASLDSLDGNKPNFKAIRPFKSPHHTSTSASIFGGGSHKAKIGEIALADGGVLFFDELPHFSKNVLESLREPLEDGKIKVSRVNSKIIYPTNFMFIGAMNPCPCGNLFDKYRDCRCSDLEISRYKNRLSDPFLDRMDMYVIMSESSKDDTSTTNSSQMHQKVLQAQRAQLERGQKTLNAKLSDQEIDIFCVLSDEAKDMLDSAIDRFKLSFRSINKVKKVSRTIADLELSKKIEKHHLLEALSYRKR